MIAGGPPPAGSLHHLVDAKASCNALSVALDKRVPKPLDEARAALARAVAAIQGLKRPGKVPAPTVVVKDTGKDRVISAKDLIADTASPGDLETAAKQLAIRAGGADAPTTLDRWARLLTRLAAELRGASTPQEKKRAVTEARDSARTIPALPEVEIWKGGVGFVSLKVYQENPATIAGASVADQLTAIAPSLSIEDRKSVTAWLSALGELEKAQAEADAAGAGLKAATEAAGKAADAFRDNLIKAWSSDDVQKALLIAYETIDLGARAGSGKTPENANYGSIDAGLMVAFPSGGSTVEPWVIPYLGANLYFTAVDRKIDFRELTGGAWLRFRQRVSITAGVTLTAPSLSGRTVKPLIIDRYPVFALGLRVSQFIRVTGGTVLYKLADKNPSSAAEPLKVAPRRSRGIGDGEPARSWRCISGSTGSCAARAARSRSARRSGSSSL